jgi:adenosylcobinamide kinase / adenosylcobinamide-phosphate guanylyltransferase
MNVSTKITVIIGGARSGKSSFAQELALQRGGKVLFCATAEPMDEEMRSRIAAHKKSRPEAWHTLEAPRNIGDALAGVSSNYHTVIVDCVTLLTANCVRQDLTPAQMEETVDKEISELIDCMGRRQSSYILVSNEVGGGIVPDSELGRAYRDLLGRANQRLAACADEVFLMVAGLRLKIK